MKLLSDYPAYDDSYHFVGSTKYRKNLFYSEGIRERLGKIIEEIMESRERIELVAITVAYNHIHVLLKTDLQPSQVGQILFGVSSRLLRKEFPVLVEQVEQGLRGGRSWGMQLGIL